MQLYNPESIIENDNRKKVLIGLLGDVGFGGGLNAFLYNMLSHMDCSKFCIHIYAPGRVVSAKMADAYKELGAVIYTGGWEQETRKVVWQDLEYLTGLYHYDAIHSNCGKVWFHYFACYFGIKNHIPKRIVHSHNALLPRIKPEVQKQDDIYRKFILENATDFLACSEKAAKWLFGSEFQGYTILKNGIDLEKYRYDGNIRIKYRKKFGVDNKFVIGHAGRFARPKNHVFLIDIFKEIINYNASCILLMAGDGELFEDIKCKAKKYGLENKCMFLGIRDDIPKLLQAMDIFVLPSLFEGFPISLIEAQTCGLPCVISGEISEEVCLLDEVKRIPLEKDAKYWAKEILKYRNYEVNRKSHDLELTAEGYDAKDAASYLYGLYIGN